MSKEITIVLTRDVVRSLHWDGDNLIDWVNGDIHYLDGVTPQKTYDSYKHYSRFDAAVVSPSGRFKVIYEKLDTKGLIMDGKEIVREINRSYYQADVYEYPVVLFQIPDGREVIAHCPEKYNKLEIDELETGKCLTQRDSKPQDFFHSRLAVTEDAKHLISAGWQWYPFDWVEIYNLEQVLKEPALLDKSSSYFESSSEISGACFLNNTTLLLCSETGAEDFDEGEPEEERRSPMRPGTFGVVDLAAKKLTRTIPIPTKIGTMFALDDKHVLGVYEHPKVVNIESGEVVESWPELKTGKQMSSILQNSEPIPPMAFDKENRRFAVAQDKTIKVLTIPCYE